MNGRCSEGERWNLFILWFSFFIDGSIHREIEGWIMMDWWMYRQHTGLFLLRDDAVSHCGLILVVEALDSRLDLLWFPLVVWNLLAQRV